MYLYIYVCIYIHTHTGLACQIYAHVSTCTQLREVQFFNLTQKEIINHD